MQISTTYLEVSQALALDAYLDEHYTTSPRYQQKGNFEVKKLDLNEWCISVDTPSFYPDCAIVGYLESGFFPSIKIDDECNLLVTCPRPTNDLEDEDYIRESFDKALDWLPKYKVVQRKFEAFQEAKEAWEVAQRALVA